MWDRRAHQSSTPCGTTPVTRGQMAVFLLRAKHGTGYDPPAATGTIFVDVPATYPLGKWIEQLAQEGITGGCATGPSQYCPDATGEGRSGQGQRAATKRPGAGRYGRPPIGRRGRGLQGLPHYAGQPIQWPNCS
jgi:hypothetical protein